MMSTILSLLTVFFIFEYAAGSSPYFDVTCQPGYKENAKASEILKTKIEKSCAYMVGDSNYCLQDCWMQAVGLLTYKAELDVENHARHLAQWMKSANAKTLADKVKSTCSDSYSAAINGEDGLRKCEGANDELWHKFFDCAEKVWKCKS